jgi:hypothetical protein
MEQQPDGRQQLSISAVVPTGSEPSAAAQHLQETAEPVQQAGSAITADVARMIAELGRRIGEVETLVPLLHDHEERVNRKLAEYDRRSSGILEEFSGRTNALHEALISHKHDLPAPLEEAPHTVVDALDSPVAAVDDALGTAIPTPEAPERTEVQAPKALKQQRVYRNMLHRGR